eukprot:Tbor_TRINITY_DN5410_c6_g1::TRINITY_DN5410_c6_g1_i1::g.25389::m.25389/K02257/COX10; protoheme IX farnesyltransferase
MEGVKAIVLPHIHRNRVPFHITQQLRMYRSVLRSITKMTPTITDSSKSRKCDYHSIHMICNIAYTASRKWATEETAQYMASSHPFRTVNTSKRFFSSTSKRNSVYTNNESDKARGFHISSINRDGCPFSGSSVNSYATPIIPVDSNTTNTIGNATVLPTLSQGTCPIMGIPPVMPCPMDIGVQGENGIDTPYIMKPLSLYEAATSLGKGKLSAFVTATATAGYVIAGGTNPAVAVILTLGTYLQSISACTANQIIEVKWDKLMKRTCRRPLLTGQVSKTTAVGLCIGELITGTGLLAALCPAAAALGVANWILYAAIYTPLKRVSATNTWWGSLVGGIPPLMGGLMATNGVISAALGPAYLLAAMMLAWQIPHFMALSFHCRRDYESAGFKMLAFKNPWRASMYAVMFSVIMTVMMIAGPTIIGWNAEPWYYPISLAINLSMVYKSIRFHQDPIRNCRSCFIFSYAYLAVMLATLSLNHIQPVAQSLALLGYFMEAYK